MDFDYLTICPVCRDVDIHIGSGMCRSCREQEQIDRDDYCPVSCPNCTSTLVVTPEWEGPNEYKCLRCGLEFVESDEGE